MVVSKTGQFLFKEMGPYCLFLTAFWSKIGSFQLKGFEGPVMCDIMGQFLFKEVGPYCLFLTAFWSKIGFPNVKAQRKDPSRQPSDPKNVGTLNWASKPQTLEPWNLKALASWNPETLEPLSPEVPNPAILSLETLKPSNPETLELWNLERKFVSTLKLVLMCA